MKSLFFISAFFYAISVSACLPQATFNHGLKAFRSFSTTAGIMATKAVVTPHKRSKRQPIGFRPTTLTEQNKALRVKIAQQQELIALLQRKIALNKFRVKPADRRIFLPTVS